MLKILLQSVKLSILNNFKMTITALQVIMQTYALHYTVAMHVRNSCNLSNKELSLK